MQYFGAPADPAGRLGENDGQGFRRAVSGIDDPGQVEAIDVHPLRVTAGISVMPAQHLAQRFGLNGNRHRTVGGARIFADLGGDFVQMPVIALQRQRRTIEGADQHRRLGNGRPGRIVGTIRRQIADDIEAGSQDFAGSLMRTWLTTLLTYLMLRAWLRTRSSSAWSCAMPIR